MQDFLMCNEPCPFSKQCKRHTDSGTIATPRTHWGLFVKTGDKDKPDNCEGYKPLKAGE